MTAPRRPGQRARGEGITRRELIRDGTIIAVGTAISAPAEGQNWLPLKLFGLEFVGSARNIQKPLSVPPELRFDSNYGGHQGRYRETAAGRCLAEVELRVVLGPDGSRTLVVYAKFAVPMALQSDETWLPVDGEYPQADGSGVEVKEQASGGPPGGEIRPGVEVDIGGLYLRSTQQKLGPVRVEGGRIWMPLHGSVLQGQGLPLRIESGDRAALNVDLSKRVVTIAAGSLVAAVYVGTPRQKGERRCLRATLGSVPIVLSPRKRSEQEQLDISFEPASPEVRLHLHGEVHTREGSTTRRAAAPLSLSEAGLKVTLAGRQPGALRVRRLSAHGLNGTTGPILHVPAVSDPVVGALRIRTTGPLALGIRPLHLGRPSTLLLTTGRIDGVILSVPGVGSPKADRPVTGLASASRFLLRGSRCSIRVGQRVGIADGGHSAVEAAVLVTQTFPLLEIPAPLGSAAEVRVAKSGWNYRGGASTGVSAPERYTFLAANGLGFPLVPASWCRTDIEKEAWRTAAGEADKPTRRAASLLKKATHESNRTEEPTEPRTPLDSVFDVVGVDRRPRKPRFEPYKACENFGFACISVRIPSGERPSYVAFRGDAIELRERLPLAAGRTEFYLPLDRTEYDWGAAFGILKYDGSKTVMEILTELEGTGPFSKEKCGSIRKNLDEQTSRREWTGLLLFDAPVDFSEFTVLKGILGGPLTVTYLACSPRSKAGDEGLSISGRLEFRNPKNAEGALGSSDEISFRVQSVTAQWLDTSLVSFEARCTARVHGILGNPRQGPARVEILGAFDRKSGRIRFIGSFSQPIQLLPEAHDVPLIRQVSVQRVEIGIGADGKGAALEIEGDVSLKALSLPSLGLDLREILSRPLGFRGLRVPFPHPSGDWLPLKIDYSSLSLDLGLPSLRLGFLDLELRGFGASWEIPSFPAPSWPDFVFPAGVGMPVGAFRWAMLRIDLGDLPVLSLNRAGRLAFDLIVGGSLDGGELTFGLRGVGFDRLRIDLMRFLELEVRRIRTEKIPTDSDGEERSSCLALEEISLRVLGTSVVEDLNAYLFGSNGRGTGFVAFSSQSVDLHWLKIHWLLVGKNVELARAGGAGGGGLPEELMRLEPPKDGQAVKAEAEALGAAISKGLFLPRSTPVGEWLVGAGFTILDLLEGRVVFQDGRYYGIRLGGALLKEWLGWDPAIAVDYFKGETAEQDRFSVAFAVPKVLLGAFALLGGTVAIKAGMDGSFLFDAGFPWRQGNYRDWRRTFGVIAGGLQGAGGFYLMHDRRLAPSGGQELVLAAGYGAEFGLGASGYSSGPFRVWARVGIYVVAEGSATLRGSTIHSLTLTGVVGVLGEASGELNWWVISVRIDIVILAEARVILQLTAGEKAFVEADFTVYARVSAHACVGWGPFKACAGISVEIAMRFGPVRLLLG